MAKANFKTNALRILETNKIEYKMHTYECKEFKDGVEIAQIVGKPQEIVFKTIVCVGASKEHYVFVVPVAKELDLKACARAVSEKSVELIPLEKAEGRICAKACGLFPPCLPVLQKGERITGEKIRTLQAAVRRFGIEKDKITVVAK